MNYIKWSVFSFLLVLVNVSSLDFDLSGIEDEPVEICPTNTNLLKLCNYRDELHVPRAYWNYIVGFYCYSYTPPDRLNSKPDPIIISTACPSLHNKTYGLYALGSSKLYAFFDYTNKTSMNLMRSLFKSDEVFSIFTDCLIGAEICCDYKMHDNNDNIYATEEYCPAVFDGWDCFPQTNVDTTATKLCTQQAYSSYATYCKLESEKVCFWNETSHKAQWVKATNYDNCSIAPVYKRRHLYNVITLIIAVILSLPAIVILLAYRSLRNSTRMCLHRNLLIVMMIRNILTILSKEIIILDQLAKNSNNVMGQNGVACRILTFFENVFKNGIYACMMVDGFYLHKQIVRSFANEPNRMILYAVSAIISCVPSLIWAIIKGVNQRGYCWLVDSNNEQWIVDGFRIAVLTVNIIILLDIIRAIITKMKQGSTSRTTKAAFRSTLVLIPLFGLHFIITADKSMIYDDSCLAEDIYEYARYTMEALQGIMVAILFCYLSSEVHSELSNTYRRMRIYLEQKFGITFNMKDIDRRPTSATYVGT